MFPLGFLKYIFSSPEKEDLLMEQSDSIDKESNVNINLKSNLNSQESDSDGFEVIGRRKSLDLKDILKMEPLVSDVIMENNGDDVTPINDSADDIIKDNDGNKQQHDVTNDVTSDVTNGVTNDDTNDVTNDVQTDGGMKKTDAKADDTQDDDITKEDSQDCDVTKSDVTKIRSRSMKSEDAECDGIAQELLKGKVLHQLSEANRKNINNNTAMIVWKKTARKGLQLSLTKLMILAIQLFVVLFSITYACAQDVSTIQIKTSDVTMRSADLAALKSHDFMKSPDDVINSHADNDMILRSADLSILPSHDDDDLKSTDDVPKPTDDVLKSTDDVMKSPDDVMESTDDVLKSPDDVMKSPASDENVMKLPDDMMESHNDVIKSTDDVIKTHNEEHCNALNSDSGKYSYMNEIGVPELSKQWVHIKDPKRVASVITDLIQAGDNKLQVIADFDFTLSCFTKNGEKCVSCHKALDDSPLLPDDYRNQAHALRNHYYPLEIDPHLTKEEKFPLMEEWWNKSHQLLIDYKLSQHDIEDIVSDSKLFLREGCTDTFKVLHKHGIPLMIFSAGLGDIINAAVAQQSQMYDNMKIVGNMMAFDNKGVITGFQGKNIHSLNKNETALSHADGYFQTLAHRDRLILLGDNLGDLRMADGAEHIKTKLTIGFLNDKIEERLEMYKDAYDIVIVNDESIDVPNAIFQAIFK